MRAAFQPAQRSGRALSGSVSRSSPRGHLADPGSANGKESRVKCFSETGSHLNKPLP